MVQLPTSDSKQAAIFDCFDSEIHPKLNLTVKMVATTYDRTMPTLDDLQPA
jgi:hypothetical protein